MVYGCDKCRLNLGSPLPRPLKPVSSEALNAVTPTDRVFLGLGEA